MNIMSYLWRENVRYGCSGPDRAVRFRIAQVRKAYHTGSIRINRTVLSGPNWQFEYLIRTLEHCCCNTFCLRAPNLFNFRRISHQSISGGYDINKTQHGVFRITLGPSPPAGWITGRRVIRPTVGLIPLVIRNTSCCILYVYILLIIHSTHVGKANSHIS